MQGSFWPIPAYFWEIPGYFWAFPFPQQNPLPVREQAGCLGWMPMEWLSMQDPSPELLIPPEIRDCISLWESLPGNGALLIQGAPQHPGAPFPFLSALLLLLGLALEGWQGDGTSHRVIPESPPAGFAGEGWERPPLLEEFLSFIQNLAPALL